MSRTSIHISWHVCTEFCNLASSEAASNGCQYDCYHYQHSHISPTKFNFSQLPPSTTPPLPLHFVCMPLRVWAYIAFRDRSWGPNRGPNPRVSKTNRDRIIFGPTFGCASVQYLLRKTRLWGPNNIRSLFGPSSVP